MKAIERLINKPIGEILEEAGLINREQLKLVLAEKELYPQFKLGEIISLHGWLKQETVDFFVEQIQTMALNEKISIAKYCFYSGLLTQKEMDSLIIEMAQSGTKFSSLVVSKNLIKQKTINFFYKIVSR